MANGSHVICSFERQAVTHERFGIFRIQLYRLAEIAARLVVLMLLPVGVAEAQPRRRVARIERGHPLPMLHGGIRLFLRMFGSQHAQRVGSHPGRRPVEREQLLGKLGRRFDGRRSPGAGVQQAIRQLLERHERLLVQGVERDDPQILCGRGLELPTPMQRTAELERGSGPMGLEIDKACPDLDGIFEPALAQEETSQTAQCRHLVGLARQQFAIGALGGIDAAGPVVGALRPELANPER